MFGGNNSNPVFPVFAGESAIQYDTNSLPQLQLFGHYPVGCNVSPVNYMGNEQAIDVDRPIKRSREGESISQLPKHQIALNSSFGQDEPGQSATVLNPNPVSTGLKLSYEEDEYNSSISSANEHMRSALPLLLSLGDNLRVEIERQRKEFDHFMKLQEENVLKGARELKQRHTVSFLSAIERGVGKKLHEKELELANMNRKNEELVERIKRVSMEVQSWQHKARYSESVVNVLKSNLTQAMAQGTIHGKEGCGDSELDYAASYTNDNRMGSVDGSGNAVSMKKQLNCKACKFKEVSILILPCRHLCLCNDCEGFIYVCPVCQVMKTASVQVYMS